MQNLEESKYVKESIVVFNKTTTQPDSKIDIPIPSTQVKATNLQPNIEQITQINTTQSTTLKNKFPKLIHRVNPSYSRNLRKRGIEGDVILSFNINNKGRVKNIRVDKSSPLKLLDGSARLALRKWRFDKNTVNEQNIKNRYQQIFTFTLDSSNSCHNGEIGSLISTDNICQNL